MDPIKLGTVVPFTGPPALRINGPRMHGGTASWLSLYNERGGWRGRPVELLVEDSAYDIERTSDAIRKLAEKDGVLALLNANGTPQLTAAMPYLQSRRLPLLLPFGGAEAWYDKGGVYCVQPPFDDVGQLLGRWAAKDGHAHVTVLYPDYPEISPLMAQQARRSFLEAAGEGRAVDMVCVPLGSTDGEAMAEAVGRRSPDAVIVLTNWPELIAVLEVLRRRGPTPVLYSWTANVTQQIADMGGALIEGMYGYSALIASPTADTPEVREYREAMARFFPDQAPDVLSMTAFAHAKVFTAALDRVEGEVTSDSLCATFDSLDACETGLLPTIGFSGRRRIGVRHVQPMRLVEGAWIPTGAPDALPER